MSEWRPPGSLLEAPEIRPSGGAWRDGKWLVTSNGAVLPDRCVKCNAPANGVRLKRTLSWHHPALYLLFLADVFLRVFFVETLSDKYARIEIGICGRHRARRRWHIAGASLVYLASALALVLGMKHNSGWLLLAGVLLLFGSGYWVAITERIVAAKRIDDNYVWLKYVNREYLAELPSWPGPQAPVGSVAAAS